MTSAVLLHLVARLERVESGHCIEAVKLVRDSLSLGILADPEPEAEHALCHAVCGHLSRALDVEDFAACDADVVEALEAEMAGRVLTYRLTRGWLVRAADAPTEFRQIADFFRCGLGARPQADSTGAT